MICLYRINEIIKFIYLLKTNTIMITLLTNPILC